MPVEKIASVSGTAVPIRGHNIDTDRIIPARFLRSTSFEGLEHHLFEDDRQQAGDAHPLSQHAYRGATLMFVNANFGCGSSREHAPQAIRRHGIRAIVGESFSEIFFGNSIAIGMPCVTVAPADAERLQAAVEEDPCAAFVLDLEEMTVRGERLAVAAAMPRAARDAFLAGSWDATAQLLDRFDEVVAVAARLPYIAGWSRRSV